MKLIIEFEGDTETFESSEELSRQNFLNDKDFEENFPTLVSRTDSEVVRRNAEENLTLTLRIEDEYFQTH